MKTSRGQVTIRFPCPRLRPNAKRSPILMVSRPYPLPHDVKGLDSWNSSRPMARVVAPAREGPAVLRGMERGTQRALSPGLEPLLYHLPRPPL